MIKKISINSMIFTPLKILRLSENRQFHNSTPKALPFILVNISIWRKEPIILNEDRFPADLLYQTTLVIPL